MTHIVVPSAPVRIDYDKDTKVLYISVGASAAGNSLARKTVVHDAPEVILDHSETGELIGVEIRLASADVAADLAGNVLADQDAYERARRRLNAHHD